MNLAKEKWISGPGPVAPSLSAIPPRGRFGFSIWFMCMLAASALMMSPQAQARAEGAGGLLNPPPGWSRQLVRDGQLFSKSFLGHEMRAHIRPWQKFKERSISAWMQKNRNRAFTPIPPARGNTHKPKIFSERDAQGAYSAAVLTVPLETRGGKAYGSVLSSCVRDGRIMTAYVYGASEGFKQSSILMKQFYSLFLQACKSPVIASAGNAPGSSPPVGAGSPARATQRAGPRPVLSKGTRPPKLKDIWYIGYFAPSVYGASGRQKAVATFSDGTVSDDMGTIFTEGIEVSRTRNPGDWGRWRIGKKGKLEIKWDSMNYYRKHSFTELLNASSKNKRLHACYSSSTAYSLGYGGTATFSASVSRWCFNENGRFSNDKTVSLSSGGGNGNAWASGRTNSDKYGWYRIDGNVIQLAYDNGARLTTSVGFYKENNPEKAMLFIGENHYDFSPPEGN
jgi:hypothetical protein